MRKLIITALSLTLFLVGTACNREVYENECLDNPERTRAIALAGQRQIAENHTIFNIAVRYLHRLKALGIN